MSTDFHPDQVTLGELIELLEKEPTGNQVAFEFCGYVPTKLSSYHGFYEHLALGYAQYRPTTVAQLLENLRKAVGGKFEGWKGGSYTMALDTPIWVSAVGAADSTAVVGVTRTEWQTYLVTKHVEV